MVVVHTTTLKCIQNKFIRNWLIQWFGTSSLDIMNASKIYDISYFKQHLCFRRSWSHPSVSYICHTSLPKCKWFLFFLFISYFMQNFEIFILKVLPSLTCVDMPCIFNATKSFICAVVHLVNYINDRNITTIARKNFKI